MSRVMCILEYYHFKVGLGKFKTYAYFCEKIARKYFTSSFVLLTLKIYVNTAKGMSYRRA